MGWAVAFELLKPGGWYFGAGWEEEQFETPPTEFAIQHGYKSAKHHVWQYRRVQTEEEYVAWQTERERLAAMYESRNSTGTSHRLRFDPGCTPINDESVLRMMHEHVLIAQKPEAASREGR